MQELSQKNLFLFFIRRFAQRLLITEKEMIRESGGIFLNLIESVCFLSFHCRKKEKCLLRCQLSSWNSFFCLFVCCFLSICSCFVHVGLHMSHIDVEYTRMQTESELKRKKHEFRVIYIIAEKNCTIFGGRFFRDVYQAGSSVCCGVCEPVSTQRTTRRVGPPRCTAASVRPSATNSTSRITGRD